MFSVGPPVKVVELCEVIQESASSTALVPGNQRQDILKWFTDFMDCRGLTGVEIRKILLQSPAQSPQLQLPLLFSFGQKCHRTPGTLPDFQIPPSFAENLLKKDSFNKSLHQTYHIWTYW